MSLKQKNSLKLNFLSLQPHLLIFKGFFFLIYRNSYSWGKGRLSSLGGRDRTRKPWCRTCISRGAGKRGEWSPQAPKYIFTWQLEMPGDWVWVAHITEYNILSLAVLTAGGRLPRQIAHDCFWGASSSQVMVRHLAKFWGYHHIKNTKATVVNFSV